jgi:hypothetical protein
MPPRRALGFAPWVAEWRIQLLAGCDTVRAGCAQSQARHALPFQPPCTVLRMSLRGHALPARATLPRAHGLPAFLLHLKAPGELRLLASWCCVEGGKDAPILPAETGIYDIETADV